MKTSIMPVSEKTYTGRSSVVSQQNQDRAQGMRNYLNQQEARVNTYSNANDEILEAFETQKVLSVSEAFKTDPLARELRSYELWAFSTEQLDAMLWVLDEYFDRLLDMTQLEQDIHRKNSERLQAELDKRTQQQAA